MIREHLAAFISQLESDPHLTVYVGVAPDIPATPYLLVVPPRSTQSRDRMVGDQSRWDGTVQVTSVGSTPDEAMWAADRARALLLDVSLTVAGRRTWPITNPDSQAVLRDDDVHVSDGTARPLHYCVDVFGLASVPADPTP